MPPVELVTFDCAETLLKVRWNPSSFALDVARDLGIELDEPVATSHYMRLLGTRWPDYQQRNTTRDRDLCVEWWRELTEDWLSACGESAEHIDPIMTRADELLYDPARAYFEVFPDVVPTLQALRSRELRLAVISNWDYSLHRILRVWGLADYFELTVASLEEGVEKPDPRLFQLTLERLGARPETTLHIGDNPLDDVEGARLAGIRALLIDRAASQSSGHVVHALEAMLEHV